MNVRKVFRPLAEVGGLVPLLLLGCGDAGTDPTTPMTTPVLASQCIIPQNLIFDAGPGKDGVRALTNPDFVAEGHPSADYIQNEDRVVGMVTAAGPMAIPLNIFWWHEIVNLDGLTITHCPLTGSSLAFDRHVVGGAEFGVSGLLYKNNLIMYDRNEEESLWPQMARGARCGSRSGDDLPMVPIIEMSWRGWRTLHPRTLVVSENTGFEDDHNYTWYPYGAYAALDDPFTLFPATIDSRRPPKERVLGIPLESGGLAFPFGLLDELGPVASVSAPFGDGEVVVFWDRSGQAAMAYDPVLGSEHLTFSVVGGKITDAQTGSQWRVDGKATSGQLAGRQLRPLADAFVAYWFAWPEFYPEIEVWTEIG